MQQTQKQSWSNGKSSGIRCDWLLAAVDVRVCGDGIVYDLERLPASADRE
jgi:hypothetical protein